jgi:uncharacterized repeat protein (TIGR03803 family)
MESKRVCSVSTLTSANPFNHRGRRHQGRRCIGRTGVLEAFYVIVVFCAATSIASASATYKDLANFDTTNGQNPMDVTLVQGIDGDLYGTTQFGGAYDEGTVFKISPSGTLATLWSFCEKKNSNGFCADGDQPMAGLTLIIGGDLYGTTFGGEHNAGTVFKITPTGLRKAHHRIDGGRSCSGSRILTSAGSRRKMDSCLRGCAGRRLLFPPSPPSNRGSVSRWCPRTSGPGIFAVLGTTCCETVHESGLRPDMVRIISDSASAHSRSFCPLRLRDSGGKWTSSHFSVHAAFDREVFASQLACKSDPLARLRENGEWMRTG